jgi:hypothetical protein
MAQRKIRQKKPKSERRNRGLAEQYREVFPPPHAPDYIEPDYSSSGQYVVSENYTTYGAGEVPIPAPLGMRRA